MGSAGAEMDFLNTRAMDHHFKSLAEVLIHDSPVRVCKTLKHFTDDSREAGTATYIKTFDLPPALSANPGAGIYISTSVWFL